MTIKTETRIISITMCRFRGGWECGYEPDCFSDMEPNFPIEHPDRLAGSNAILASDKDVDELISYWEKVVQKANRGYDHEKYESFEEYRENFSMDDQIFALNDEELQRGDEWTLAVKELDEKEGL